MQPLKIGKIDIAGGAIDNVVGFEGYGRTGLNMAKNGRAVFRPLDQSVSVTDDVLMMRIAKGDRIAAQTLMQRCLPRVLGMARRLLDDAVEAEDIAQETFLRVWKAANRWQSGQAKVSTWIGRIAINLCYDRLRKKREVLTDALPERQDPSADQEVQYVQEETSDRLSVAMRELPERQKQALELVHFQEMSNIEAAEIMSVSVDALESLLARGRRKLKALLIKDAGDLMSSYNQVSTSHEGVAK